MKAWGVYDDEIEEIAASVGLRILHPGVRRDGAGYRFRLALSERRPNGALKFQRVGRWGRTSGVCWHGHREFMFALFRRFPEARLDSAIARYYGRQHFLNTYAATRERRSWNMNREQRCVCNLAERAAPATIGLEFSISVEAQTVTNGLTEWMRSQLETPASP